MSTVTTVWVMFCLYDSLQTSMAGELWDLNFVLPTVCLLSSFKTGCRFGNSLYFSPGDGGSSLSLNPMRRFCPISGTGEGEGRYEGAKKTLFPLSLLPLDQGRKGALAQLCSRKQCRTLQRTAGWRSQTWARDSPPPRVALSQSCRACRDHYCEMPKTRGKSFTCQVPWRSSGSNILHRGREDT